nr:MAG TPA: hypothetical protein [Caudoviricetes sp.]
MFFLSFGWTYDVCLPNLIIVQLGILFHINLS